MIETSTETKKEFAPTDDMELIDDAFYVCLLYTSDAADEEDS